VDANQGYVPKTLSQLLPALVDEGVSLLEQPCRRDHEADLDGIDHVVPIAADESILDLAELENARTGSTSSTSSSTSAAASPKA
jgi:L-alanine-DL-glutamate epimerase-like enolase superfamily enzyme